MRFFLGITTFKFVFYFPKMYFRFPIFYLKHIYLRNIHYIYICETSILFALMIKILLKCKYIKVLTNVFLPSSRI